MAAIAAFFLSWFASDGASAQAPVQTNGLRGGRHVGSAGAISTAPRLALDLGFAHTEAVLDQHDAHQRVFSELALAYAPRGYLQVAVGVDGRFDKHRGDLGADQGVTFGSQLETRHAFRVGDGFSLAGRTKLRFPPAMTVKRGLRATTPELGAIATYLFGRSYELSVDLGYRFDRSDRSIDSPTVISRADLLGASISRFDAALLGALFALPLGPVSASAEWSWDIALGGGAPPALASPMRVRLAAQTRVAGRYLPGVELGVSPSARPSIERLSRIEPRVWFALTFAIMFETAGTQSALAAAEAETPALGTDAPTEQPAALQSEIKGQVRSLRQGRPVHARITIEPLGEVVESAADGSFVIAAPPGRYKLEISAKGYQTQHRSALIEPSGVTILVIDLATSLP